MAESSAAPQSTEPGLPEAGPPSPPYMPGWLLYWMAIATFGIYLPFWVYRFGRTRPEPDRDRGRAVAWALGSLAPPTCWALLREFHNASLGAIVGEGRRRSWWSEFPAALYLALLIVGGLSPLRHFILTPLFLLPLPFVMVQRAANRAGSAAPDRRVPVWQWVVTSIGTILVAAVVWVEAPGFVQRLRPLQSAGATVAAVSDAFCVTIPGSGWRRLAPGTLGDDDSDLELMGPGVETWLVAYTRPVSDTNLHIAVDSRRTMIFAEGEPLGFDEQRFFLEGSDEVPVSVATYAVDYGLGSKGVFHILTAETDDHVIEVLTYTSEANEYLQVLRKMVLSFAVLATVPEDDNGS